MTGEAAPLVTRYSSTKRVRGEYRPMSRLSWCAKGLWTSTGSKPFGAYSTQSDSAGMPSSGWSALASSSSCSSILMLTLALPKVLEPRAPMPARTERVGAWVSDVTPATGSKSWSTAFCEPVAGGRPAPKLWITMTGRSEVNGTAFGASRKNISPPGAPGSRPVAKARARIRAVPTTVIGPVYAALASVTGAPSTVYRITAAAAGPSSESDRSKSAVKVRPVAEKTTSGAKPAPWVELAVPGVGFTK